MSGMCECLLSPENLAGQSILHACPILQWSPDGEQLAIIPNGNTTALVWSLVSKEVKKIDTDFKTQVFTALAWSKTGKYLAMGTAKGNLLVYNW